MSNYTSLISFAPDILSQSEELIYELLLYLFSGATRYSNEYKSRPTNFCLNLSDDEFTLVTEFAIIASE